MSGRMTGDLGGQLRSALAPQGLDVLYDHGTGGQEGVGKPTLWFGSEYSRATRLGQLDIAVVERETDRALVLFEIEETSADPKQLLGDVFATLFSERLAMPKPTYRELDYGKHTTLAVLIKITREQHLARLRYLQERIDGLKPFALRDVVLDAFVEAEDLQRKAMRMLRKSGISGIS